MITNVFPHLLDYSFLATTLLRVTLGFMFVWFAYSEFFKSRHPHGAFFERLGFHPERKYIDILTSIGGILGILLLVGVYTQIAALATGILMVLAIVMKLRTPRALAHNPIEFYVLLAIVSFVLVFLGAGAFAFDLPL